jgi:hypothetical protein
VIRRQLLLFIHQRCGRLVQTLPSLQHDTNRPEDVLKVGADEMGLAGDDVADALRCLVATKGTLCRGAEVARGVINARTERCGRPRESDLATDVARPRSFQ